MSLLDSVKAADPLSGVKRSALSAGGVPSQLPSKRGRDVEPGGAVKAPGLRNGNRPNRGTNVTIPYARVSPLKFLDSSSGMQLSPGDVAFVKRVPECHMSDARDVERPGGVVSQLSRQHRQEFRKLPHGQTNSSGPNDTDYTSGDFPPGSRGASITSPGMMGLGIHRVVGLDGMNEMLRGGVLNTDLKVGYNVIRTTVAGVRGDMLPGKYGFLKKLSLLDEYALDGVIISNDEPDSFSANGSRDNVLFNIAVEGRAQLNNGFRAYQLLDMPDVAPDDYAGIEAHKRMYREPTIQRNPTVGRNHAWNVEQQNRGNAYGFDFVADFKGTYTAYPMQMFDRNPMVGICMYVGLRAVECNGEMLNKIKNEDGTFLTAAQQDNYRYFYFQYMPYSQRIADHIELTQRALALHAAGNSGPLMLLEAGARDSSRTAAKASLEDDEYSPIKRADWEMMVGAWTVGTVIDTSSARQATFNYGPPDTTFKVAVSVSVKFLEWTHNQGVAPGAKATNEEFHVSGARTSLMPYGSIPAGLQEGAAMAAANPNVATAHNPSAARDAARLMRGQQQNPTLTGRAGGRTFRPGFAINTNGGTGAVAVVVGSGLSGYHPARGWRRAKAPWGLTQRRYYPFDNVTDSRTIPSGDRAAMLYASDSAADLITGPVPGMVTSWATAAVELQTLLPILGTLYNNQPSTYGGRGIDNAMTVYQQLIPSQVANITEFEALRFSFYVMLRVAANCAESIAALVEDATANTFRTSAVATYNATPINANIVDITGFEKDNPAKRELYAYYQYAQNELGLFKVVERLYQVQLYPRRAVIFAPTAANGPSPLMGLDSDRAEAMWNAVNGQVQASFTELASLLYSTVLPRTRVIYFVPESLPIAEAYDANNLSNLPAELGTGVLGGTGNVTYGQAELGRLQYSVANGEAVRLQFGGTNANPTDNVVRRGVGIIDLKSDLLGTAAIRNILTGSQVYYPTHDANYNAFGVPQAGPGTNILPTFRAAVGLSNARVQRAWILIQRALRRYPIGAATLDATITGRQLFDVLRMPMWITGTNGGDNEANQNLSRALLSRRLARRGVQIDGAGGTISFDQANLLTPPPANPEQFSIGQFTFGATVRELLALGSNLFYVQSDVLLDTTLQRKKLPAAGPDPSALDAPAMSRRTAIARQQMIKEIVRRIARAVPASDPLYGKITGLPGPNETGPRDWEQVIITWKHFYSYFAAHGTDVGGNVDADFAQLSGSGYKDAVPTNAASSVIGPMAIEAANLPSAFCTAGETDKLPFGSELFEERHTDAAIKFAGGVFKEFYDLPDLEDGVASRIAVMPSMDAEFDFGDDSMDAEGLGNAQPQEAAQASTSGSVAQAVMESVAPAATAVPAATAAATARPAPPIVPAAPARAPAPTSASGTGAAAAASQPRAPAAAPSAAAGKARKKSPAKKAPEPTATSASLLDTPVPPTLSPSAPPATRAAVGGAAAARAPQSRASTASVAAAAESAMPAEAGQQAASSTMSSTVASVFGALFGDETTPASTSQPVATSSGAVPRSPSPTPSSGSEGSGAVGPRAFSRRSRS